MLKAWSGHDQWALERFTPFFYSELRQRSQHSVLSNITELVRQDAPPVEFLYLDAALEELVRLAQTT
jgi:hypothetical protein